MLWDDALASCAAWPVLGDSLLSISAISLENTLRGTGRASSHSHGCGVHSNCGRSRRPGGQPRGTEVWWRGLHSWEEACLEAVCSPNATLPMACVYRAGDISGISAGKTMTDHKPGTLPDIAEQRARLRETIQTKAPPDPLPSSSCSPAAGQGSFVPQTRLVPGLDSSRTRAASLGFLSRE